MALEIFSILIVIIDPWTSTHDASYETYTHTHTHTPVHAHTHACTHMQIGISKLGDICIRLRHCFNIKILAEILDCSSANITTEGK